jgi:glycosyltransferase involved in cell wall biosynthesis
VDPRGLARYQAGDLRRRSTPATAWCELSADRAAAVSEVTDKVTACIVTYNSERFLDRCLAALDLQTRRPAQVLVWDNASADCSAARAKAHGAEVILSASNVGFARAANELIERTTTPYVLLLNPDAYLQPRYIERLEQAGSARSLSSTRRGTCSAGIACP